MCVNTHSLNEELNCVNVNNCSIPGPKILIRTIPLIKNMQALVISMLILIDKLLNSNTFDIKFVQYLLLYASQSVKY